MTKDHRRLDAQTVQGILLDDPDFLHEIVERVLQELLEAEMTEHIGAAPHQRTNTRKGHRNGYKPQDASYEGGHSEPTRTPGPRRDLLHQAL